MLASLTLAAAMPPAQAVRLAADSEAQWVAFELTPTNQIRFTARIAGRPVRALLDTGVTHSLVTPAFAAMAGLRPGGSARAQAIGGAVALRWTDRVALSFGGASVAHARIGIAGFAGAVDLGADALIGSDVLGCCAIDIDYAARRFRMLASGRMPFVGARVPLAPSRGGDMPATELRIAGSRVRAVIVDTGDGAGATLSRDAWDRLGTPAVPVTTTLGWGAGGAVISEMAVLPDVAPAGASSAAAEVRIEAPGGYTAAAGAAGRIGNAILSRYRVLIDLRAGRMVLRADPAAIAAPVPRSTSGLLMGYTAGRLRILHVMRGSPAAEQGWRAGETICAVDGAPIGTDVDWSTGTPGRRVTLTPCEGADRTLTLRRFY